MENNSGFKSENIEQVIKGLQLKSAGFVASLSLQMSIYFNSYLAPIWIISQILSLRLKFDKLESEIHSFMASISLIILIAIELPRLYLGYFGNIMEKTRFLLAFVLLSVLIQFPIHIFRLTSTIFGVLVTPFELIMDSIVFSFLVLQIILSINTLAKSTKYQICELNKQE